METFEILRIKDRKRERVKDQVTSEVPLTIELNGKELVALLCSPDELEDLVRGFLYTSGFIKENEDLEKILIDRERWTAKVHTSGCGKGTVGGLNSNFQVASNNITKLMQEFRRKSTQFIKTGGVHSAALSSEEEILIFREDIGRHNACDKVIGRALLEGLDLEKMVLLTSGRVSSEILLKSQKGKIPLIVSRGAPTNQAVRLARQRQITLVGFARGTRMSVYSCEGRIL
jgi:FdhD protein